MLVGGIASVEQPALEQGENVSSRSVQTGALLVYG
jgi:hypothetical protein